MSTIQTDTINTSVVHESAPIRFVLTEDERLQIRQVIAELMRTYKTVEDPAFLDEADVRAHELPRRLRRTLRAFRLEEPTAALCLVKGWPIDQTKAGPTPPHWKQKDGVSRTLEEEMLLVLVGSLLGELIAWSTQQDGRIVHDVLPIKGNEHEQLGTGSEQTLWWHVEDAFHPCRGDYLGLMCLRNPDGVATTFAPIARAGLSAEQIRLLSEPRFTIRPDESHTRRNCGGSLSNARLESAYANVQTLRDTPQKVAVLFGVPDAPYVRLDPYFMDLVDGGPDVKEALDTAVARVDAVLEDLILEPGDICFIDNYQGVHGRRPFRARFDGTDRWLKRINVARDLRKSRELRETAASRVLY